MQKILKNNGYSVIRCSGDHFIYSNGTNKISVNMNINCMVAGRLIKEHSLIVEKKKRKTRN
ncbi:hypothetical protein P261_00049 [Lachnospiraceae bacterium TWA4]|nr:hypothetical protein P261_00049 [Lachnospiraceae bacterium TWA4]